VLYAEWGYDEHFYAGYCYAECHHVGCILLSALCRFAEFDYAGCCAELHYARYEHAECCYTE
jgi:hypothetical protein